MLCSKNSINLSVFIPPFSYKSQFTTPLAEIANTPVYFLNTSCDCVFITQRFLYYYNNDFVFVMILYLFHQYK